MRNALICFFVLFFVSCSEQEKFLGDLNIGASVGNKPTQEKGLVAQVVPKKVAWEVGSAPQYSIIKTSCGQEAIKVSVFGKGENTVRIGSVHTKNGELVRKEYYCFLREILAIHSPKLVNLEGIAVAKSFDLKDKSLDLKVFYKIFSELYVESLVGFDQRRSTLTAEESLAYMSDHNDLISEIETLGIKFYKTSIVPGVGPKNVLLDEIVTKHFGQFGNQKSFIELQASYRPFLDAHLTFENSSASLEDGSFSLEGLKHILALMEERVPGVYYFLATKEEIKNQIAASGLVKDIMLFDPERYR